MKTRVAFFLFCAILIGQAAPASAQSAIRNAPAPTYAVGLQFGTTGLGLQVARRLDNDQRLTGRVGVSYLAYRQSINLKTENDGHLTLDPDLMIGLAQASLKWHPFRRSAFFLTGGGGYSWHPNVGAVMTTNDKVTLGGLELSKDNFGTVRTDVRWNSLVGYAGLGFGRSVPRKRVGFAVELGCYYLGKPKLDVQYDGFLEVTDLREQIPTIEKNLSGYRYLPSLQFLITYAIR